MLPFLNLPAEIQQSIYNLICIPESLTLTITGYTDRLIFGPILKSSIFRVCRQLRTDALTYLLAINEVSIKSTKTACLFFNYIGDSIRDIEKLEFIHTTTIPNNRTGMTNVQGGKNWREADFFMFLEGAQNLRSLKIVVRRWELELDVAAIQQRERMFLKELREFLEQRMRVKFQWRVETVLGYRNKFVRQEWNAALEDMAKECSETNW